MTGLTPCGNNEKYSSHTKYRPTDSPCQTDSMNVAEKAIFHKNTCHGKVCITKKDDAFCRFGTKTCELECLQYSYPLKILAPEHACSGPCRWIYFTTFGGGLVEGNTIDISVCLGQNTTALIATSSSTKVFPCEKGLITQQIFSYHVLEGALLGVLPDPTVCYRGAHYFQHQDLYLTRTSSVALVDWLVAGRIALDEDWDMKRFHTLTKIFLDNRLVFHDAVILEDTENLTVKAAMKHYKVIATLVLIGEATSHSIQVARDVFGKPRSFGEPAKTDPLVAVSSLSCQIPGVCVKIASSNTNQVYGILNEILSPLHEVFGGDPYENKY